MKVAIASGKGGTGKTTVSASLATVRPNPLYVMNLDADSRIVAQVSSELQSIFAGLAETILNAYTCHIEVQHA